MALVWWTHDDFVGLVGDRFELVGPTSDADHRTSELALELTGTWQGRELGGPGPQGQQRHQFSLEFTGPAQPRLEQRTWTLRHADLGELELFLTPVGAGPDGVRYEAAFA